MKLVVLGIVATLIGCTDAGTSRPKILTYDELVNYPKKCSQSKVQLTELRYIQKIKNFDPDPDNLDDDEREYNSQLKSTIWWYAYRCEKS